MPQNRLHLDWKLSSIGDRKNFIEQYLPTLGFAPTEEELEMMTNYILWGKSENGKNGFQEKDFLPEGKFKAWNEKEAQSLEELQESPTFNEASIQPLTPGTIVPKITRQVFNRQEALEKADPRMREDFQDLFRRIDETDLLVEFYELAHDKRTKPIRESLMNRFDNEEILNIRNRAASLNQRQYLQKKHQLVDLRTEQYSLSDGCSGGRQVLQHGLRPIIQTSAGRFDADIPVYPLGLKYKNNNLVFFQEDELCGTAFDNAKLQQVNKILEDHKKSSSSSFLDFTDLDHVYNLLLNLDEIEFWAETDTSVESTTQELLETIYFYIEMADLNEMQSEILKMKCDKVKNPDIASYINKKYKKNYTANYISTIFRQKIIKQINEAAEYHLRLVENLFYPENFKECNCCGKTYLIDPKNFVRKTRSKDGFANRCKKCDKNDRERRKEN